MGTRKPRSGRPFWVRSPSAGKALQIRECRHSSSMRDRACPSRLPRHRVLPPSHPASARPHSRSLPSADGLSLPNGVRHARRTRSEKNTLSQRRRSLLESGATRFDSGLPTKRPYTTVQQPVSDPDQAAASPRSLHVAASWEREGLETVQTDYVDTASLEVCWAQGSPSRRRPKSLRAGVVIDGGGRRSCRGQAAV
jgi:hypothetical protein